jgi:membrane associated rhomboid family serine protease
MQTERTFIDDIKYQFRYGGMTIRLLILNAAVFIGIQLILVIGRLIGGEFDVVANELLRKVFALHTDPVEFLLHPWGLFTSIFSHFGFFHFLFNMLVLYFSGNIFLDFFRKKDVWRVYIWGGVVAG